MKRIIISLTIFFCFIMLLSTLHKATSYYTREVTVVNINNQEIIVSDNYNNLWAFYGTNYVKGQKIKVVMYNNNTDSIITDDEIVRVKS